MILPDVLESGLHVVFCGTAVSDSSKKANGYYAGPGNRFWLTLQRTGLTPVLIAPQAFDTIRHYGLGLTDIVKGRSGSDASLDVSDYDVGSFRAKIQVSAPALVAFNGKTAARKALGLSDTAPIKYGPHMIAIHQSVAWVLPSTSNRTVGEWDERHWANLADQVKRLRTPK